MDPAQLMWISGGLIAAGIVLLLISLGAASRSRTKLANRMAERVRQLTEQVDAMAEAQIRLTGRVGQLEQPFADAETPTSNNTEPSDPAAMSPQGDSPPNGAEHPTISVHTAIVRLMQQGLDAVEIARRVSMNVGEVELVQNLHSRRKDDGAGE